VRARPINVQKMNAVYNSDETPLKSALQTLIDQHGLLRVLATLLIRAARRRDRPRTTMAKDLSEHMRRDIGL